MNCPDRQVCTDCHTVGFASQSGYMVFPASCLPAYWYHHTTVYFCPSKYRPCIVYHRTPCVRVSTVFRGARGQNPALMPPRLRKPNVVLLDFQAAVLTACRRTSGIFCSSIPLLASALLLALQLTLCYCKPHGI